MKLSSHLNFNGECRAAFAFYAACLGGTVTFTMNYGDSPAKEQTAPDWHDKVMHTTLTVGDYVLMGCDAPPTHYAPPQGIQLSVSVASAAEAERVFNALAEGGKTTMPFQKTFWSSGFGMLVDRYGIAWMVGADQAA